MSISLTIPESYVLPLFNAVVDGSQAGNLTEQQPALLVGQKLASGVAAFDDPILIGSPSVAARQFGIGSMLERMATAFFSTNTTQQLWAVPVADPTSGIAATGSITITATPTASGIIYLYITDQLVTAPAYTTDTTATIATRLVQAINAKTTLPVTAILDNGSTAGKIDLTAKWKGDTGNDIRIGFNLLGLYGGQAFPVGLAVTVAPMSGGNGQPDFTAILSAIASKTFTHVALPYSDTASLSEFDTEFGFTENVGRWSYLRQQYGWVYNAMRNDYADSLQWGLAHNSAVITTMAIEPTMPSTVWSVTASYCAVGSYFLLDDPARPLQTLPLTGIIPAPASDRYTAGELNNLAGAGLAIQGVNLNGVPTIIREVMQYTLNSYGQGDSAFNLLTTLSTLAELLNRMKQAITSKYPRVKLAPDGTKFGAGQAIVTPLIIKGELVSEAVQAIRDGLMVNLQAFTDNLIVEIDDNNPNRLNVLWAPQLIGQLRQFNVLAQFRLLYNSQS